MKVSQMTHKFAAPEDDSNFEKLATCLSGKFIPEYVSVFSPSDLTIGNGAETPLDFADMEGKKFASHTGASCWVSAAYLQSYPPEDSAYTEKVAARLSEAASQLGILEDVQDMLTSAVQLSGANEKRAHESPQPSSGEGLLTVKTAEDVANAADALWAADCMLQDRIEPASDLLKFASRSGLSMSYDTKDRLQKMAADGVPDVKLARLEYTRRVRLEPKCAEHLPDPDDEEVSLLARADRIKIAATYSAVDQEFGMEQYYGQGVTRPEDIFFPLNLVQMKEAADSLVHLMNGESFDKTAFDCLSCGDLRETFGGDFASECGCGLLPDQEKLAEIAATLPAPDADTFSGLLATHEKTAALRLPAEKSDFLEKQAAAYQG